jgi:hypothetical protein
MRAVVFVTEATPKGSAPSPQEYVRPLLVLPGHEYATIPFGERHRMICELLRGDRPRLAAEVRRPDGGSRLLLEDGSVQVTELGGA